MSRIGRRALPRHPERLGVLPVPLLVALVAAFLFGLLDPCFDILFLPGEGLVRALPPLRQLLVVLPAALAVYALFWVVPAGREILRRRRAAAPGPALDRLAAGAFLLVLAMTMVVYAARLPGVGDYLRNAQQSAAAGDGSGLLDLARWKTPGVEEVLRRYRDGPDPGRSAVGAAILFRFGDRSPPTVKRVRALVEKARAAVLGEIPMRTLTPEDESALRYLTVRFWGPIGVISYVIVRALSNPAFWRWWDAEEDRLAAGAREPGAAPTPGAFGFFRPGRYPPRDLRYAEGLLEKGGVRSARRALTVLMVLLREKRYEVPPASADGWRLRSLRARALEVLWRATGNERYRRSLLDLGRERTGLEAPPAASSFREEIDEILRRLR